jgi:hypothetical protein
MASIHEHPVKYNSGGRMGVDLRIHLAGAAATWNGEALSTPGKTMLDSKTPPGPE